MIPCGNFVSVQLTYLLSGITVKLMPIWTCVWHRKTAQELNQSHLSREPHTRRDLMRVRNLSPRVQCKHKEKVYNQPGSTRPAEYDLSLNRVNTVAALYSSEFKRSLLPEKVPYVLNVHWKPP